MQEVMHAVEAAMFMQWRHEGSGYVLRLQQDVGEEEQEARQESDREHRQGVIGTLNQLVKISKETEDELAVEDQTLRDRRDQLLQQEADPNSPEVKENAWDLSLRNTNDEMVLGDLFVGRVESLAGTLLSHNALIASDEALSDVLSISKRFVEQLSPPGESASTRYLELLKLNLGGRAIKLISRSTGGLFGFNSLDLRPAYALAHIETRLDKRLLAWASLDDDTTNRPIASDSFLVASPYRKIHSASEQLVDLSQRSGIPLVADSYRLAISDESSLKAKTVAGWISKFKQLGADRSFGFEPGFFRTENGWMMYRSRHYWEDDQQEIPEKLLSDIRKAPKNIDTFAGLISSLTSEQRNGLDRLVLLDFDGSQELASNKELLQLWATLDPLQQESARSGGLPFSRLSNAQLVNVRQVIANLSFEPNQSYVTLLMSLLRQKAQLSDLTLSCSFVPPNPAGEPDSSQIRGAFDPVKMVPSAWKTVIMFSSAAGKEIAHVEMKMPKG